MDGWLRPVFAAVCLVLGATLGTLARDQGGLVVAAIPMVVLTANAVVWLIIDKGSGPPG